MFSPYNIGSKQDAFVQGNVITTILVWSMYLFIKSTISLKSRRVKGIEIGYGSKAQRCELSHKPENDVEDEVFGVVFFYLGCAFVVCLLIR